MAAGIQRGGEKRIERYLPLAYFALAVILVIILLPTILRPPHTQSQTTAELSPDAPPDAQQSIVSAFNRGSTGTAGNGPGIGPASEGVGTNGPGPGPGGGSGGPGAAAAACP